MPKRAATIPHLRAVPDAGADAIDAATTPQVEIELVHLAAAGDGQAWTRLYQQSFDHLYRDMLYLVDSASVAEELVQETFAAALTSLARFDRRSTFRTWLRGIAHNLVRKHWRTHVRRGRAYGRFEAVADMSAARPDDPEVAQVQERRARALVEVLDTLPASLREVFVLRDVQGLEVDEVAARLRISAGNVRVRATRARARIRAELGRRGLVDVEGSP